MFARSRSLLVSLVSVGALSGCLTENQGSFRVSRSFFGDGGIDSLAGSLDSLEHPAEACGVVALMVVPVAVDVVLLPVTVPMDLWRIWREPGGPPVAEPTDWDSYETSPSVELL